MKIVELGKNILQIQGFRAFIPNKFPPKDFEFGLEILKKNAEATRLLGKLDGITKLLLDIDFFLLMYLKKDAACSSQIEGTRATVSDAIEIEIASNQSIPKDVDDILHYIKALNYGIKRINKLPLSLRFIRELHDVLMRGARSTQFSDPGEFRNSQNWLGGTRPDNARFVPPPVHEMKESLNDLEKFIYSDDEIPILIKTGLLHAQFETIHPFLDGNGRTGRMLITFYLWKEQYLEKPVLFLSSYFKKYQSIYYEKLTNYANGKVSEWLDFFLDGIIEISNEAIMIVEKITLLREKNINKIQTFGKRASESALMILPKLYEQPIVNNAIIQKWTGFTRMGSQTVISRFVDIGILVPKYKDKKYAQVYVYKDYLDIFI